MVKIIEILKTSSCSSCIQATKLIKKIKEKEHFDFEIVEIDIIENPEYLEKYQIMVSPGIVIDGKLVFTGVPGEKEILKVLKKSSD